LFLFIVRPTANTAVAFKFTRASSWFSIFSKILDKFQLNLKWDHQSTNENI
jgi:hypothetical protein